MHEEDSEGGHDREEVQGCAGHVECEEGGEEVPKRGECGCPGAAIDI